jgi:hypothetical protein
MPKFWKCANNDKGIFEGIVSGMDETQIDSKIYAMGLFPFGSIVRWKYQNKRFIWRGKNDGNIEM